MNATTINTADNGISQPRAVSSTAEAPAVPAAANTVPSGMQQVLAAITLPTAARAAVIPFRSDAMS
jgi:hypothetical protein